MTFTVGVVATFTARHHLVGDFGPASQPHEHDYRVEIAVSGDELGRDGTLVDITRLQRALASAIADLHGHDLNTVASFAAINPTAEALAYDLFKRVAPALFGLGLGQLMTRVWESPEAYASYAGDLG